MSEETVEVSCVIKHTTESAHLIDDGTKQVWIPIRCVVDIDASHTNSCLTMTLPVWLAKDRGLI